jgi:hypothetical protein
MEPTKDLKDVQRKAIDLREVLIRVFKRELGEFGNLADQLRVLGYCAEAMLTMAETELRLLKAQGDAEGRPN